MRETYSAVYIINIVFQSIFTLLMYICAPLLLSWVLVNKCGAPTWIYAILIIIGVIMGFISMIKFIISTMNTLDTLEKSHKAKRRNNGNKNK